MRALRTAVLSLIGGFGFALLALAVFHTTTVGNCASGNVPYQIANPCPSNTGYWFGALFAGIAITGASFALLRSGLATPAIFFAVGGACVAALATGAANSSWLIASIALAVLFLPLGGWMLWNTVQRPPPRAAALVPVAALGALGAVAAALAIPGPLEQPKQTTSAQIRAVTANDARSWFRETNLRRALTTVTSTLGPSARFSSMTLQPGESVISAVVGQTSHSFNFTVGEQPQDFTSTSSGRDTVAIGAIDTKGPTRVLAELKRRFHIAAARVEHVDFGINAVTGAASWSAYLKGTAAYYQGNTHGKGLKRVSF